METYRWLVALHLTGVFLWIGPLLSILNALNVHGKADTGAHAALTAIEKRAARVMDLGAALAMGAGFYMAFGVTPSAFKTGAWLHIKLTLVVVVILGLHGLVRVKIKKFSRGEVKPLPGFFIPIALIGSIAIIILGAAPILRK